MPVQKLIDLYKFEELSEDAQKKAIERYRDWNVDYEWWDAEYDYWKDHLAEWGFEDVDIMFSGFWSQGDGASFTAKDVDVFQFIKKEKLTKQFQSLLAIRQHDWSVWGHIQRASYPHYVHEHMVSAVVETDYTSENVERENRIYKLVEDLQEILTEFVRDKSREIYRALEKEYEYLTSDEAIIESLEINDVLFWENGRIY